jgi:hypothetical protein
LPRFFEFCEIGREANRHSNGFAPTINRALLEQSDGRATVPSFRAAASSRSERHNLHGPNPNFSRLQVEAAGASAEKPDIARTVCDDGVSLFFRWGLRRNPKFRRSHSRRQTSFAPSDARKRPSSRKTSRVHDSRICVSMRICHASRDIGTLFGARRRGLRSTQLYYFFTALVKRRRITSGCRATSSFAKGDLAVLRFRNSRGLGRLVGIVVTSASSGRR